MRVTRQIGASPDDRSAQGRQDLGEPAEPALGMAVDERGLARLDLGPDDARQVVGDHAAVADPGLQEQSLADRVDRHLEDVREPVVAPGEERQVVVAELEVGRVKIAQLLQNRVEPGVPAAVGRGEADRLEPRRREDLVGAEQVPPVRLARRGR